MIDLRWISLPGLAGARGSTARWRCLALLATACTAASACALTVDEARHLLTRTGFGAAPHEIRTLLPLTKEQAVDHLLDGLSTAEVATAPAFLNEPMADYLQRLGDRAPADLVGLARSVTPMSTQDTTHLIHQGMQEMAQLRVWWLDQMISTPSPMAERLALFWHGHFTSKYFSVRAPRLMFDQLQKIRTLGSRNFADLLAAMMRDPAMLIFLDNALNRRQSPNENFARELLELFTLGVGNYREQDIKEFARILAGHSVDFTGSWGYLTRPQEMDTGVKTFLGQTGPWALEDALRILLANPRTARYIAGKFHQEFVSPKTDAAEIDRLATVLRNNQYEMRPFLRALFLGKEFWTPANRGQLVKSPVELLVGLVRSFGVASPDLEMLNTYAHILGQELFEPPTVQGWLGGMNWLSASAIASRASMINAMWTSRPAGVEYLAAGPNDLLVRYSAESNGKVPARFHVQVNGQEVYRGQARWPSDTAGQGQLSPKPAWDIARVPRDRLPANIETINVVFEKPQGDYPNMFLNWVQVDGKRLPAYLTTVKFDPVQDCSETQVPRGMMYCSADARFDLARIAGAQGLPDTTLYDRVNGPVNSIIESGTSRVALAMRPAARTREALMQTVAAQWTSLTGGGRRADLLAATTAVAPLQPASAQPRNTEEFLKGVALDPTYNLK